MSRNEDFLVTELWKLKKKLIMLEFNYEAKIMILKNHNEEKKIQKLKNDFTLKSESNLEEQRLITERIEDSNKKRMFEEHTKHMRQWENILEKINNVPNAKNILKVFCELVESGNGWDVPYPELFSTLIQQGYTKDEVDQSLKCLIEYHIGILNYERYTNTIHSRFIIQIRKL